MSYLIELQDTCKYFGGLKAVDHVNLVPEKPQFSS